MEISVQPQSNNCFHIYTNKGTYLQSYNSIIAFMPIKGKIQLDAHFWDYSRTTGKHRNDFLDECIAETRAKIESKEYLLTNLNK